MAACIAWLLGASLACGGGSHAVRKPTGPVDIHSLYPLGAGQAWSYDVDVGDGGDRVLAVSRVVDVQGDTFLVRSGGNEVLRYAHRPDGWYRPDRGAYLLRGPVAVGTAWPSGGGGSAEITAVEQRVQSPAGTFERCVVVSEQGAASGQQVRTTYCPGVGPTEVVSSMTVRGQPLRVVATLRGYTTLAPAP